MGLPEIFAVESKNTVKSLVDTRKFMFCSYFLYFKFSEKVYCSEVMTPVRSIHWLHDIVNVKYVEPFVQFSKWCVNISITFLQPFSILCWCSFSLPMVSISSLFHSSCSCSGKRVQPSSILLHLFVWRHPLP